jgi:dihydrofolate synthase/folylpolyglutamate synthase
MPEIKTRKFTYKNFDLINMLGQHQVQNAAVAIGVSEALQDIDFAISTDSIRYGIETASHPGRLEYVGRFLLDGAHNVAGAEALAAYLDEFVDKPITMIFGAMKGKDVSGIAKVLWPRAERLILARPNNTRSMPAKELSEFAPKAFDREKIILTNSVEDALEAIGSADLVLVTGSLYLVGEVRKLVESKT